MNADNLPRPSAASWPDVQQWWDVIRAALAEDPYDSHAHRLALRREDVELAYGDAEAVAALRDVWAERDALQRRMDSVRAWCESIERLGPMVERASGLMPRTQASVQIAREIRRLLDGEATDE